MIVYDIETCNTHRVVPYAPYANCVYRLSKMSAKYNRDITEREYEKCRKDCFVLQGLDNFNEMMDYVLQLKREPKKTDTKNC